MTKLSAFDAAYSLRDESTSVYLAVLIYSLNISRGLYIVKKREETQLFRVKQVVFLKSVFKIG